MRIPPWLTLHTFLPTVTSAYITSAQMIRPTPTQSPRLSSRVLFSGKPLFQTGLLAAQRSTYRTTHRGLRSSASPGPSRAQSTAWQNRVTWKMLDQCPKQFKILVLLSRQQKHIHKGHIIAYSILDIYFSHTASIFHVTAGSQNYHFSSLLVHKINLLFYIKGHSSHLYYSAIKDYGKISISGEISFSLWQIISLG